MAFIQFSRDLVLQTPHGIALSHPVTSHTHLLNLIDQVANPLLLKIWQWMLELEAIQGERTIF